MLLVRCEFELHPFIQSESLMDGVFCKLRESGWIFLKPIVKTSIVERESEVVRVFVV